jgi:hypothetical protein
VGGGGQEAGPGDMTGIEEEPGGDEEEESGPGEETGAPGDPPAGKG